jgi:hypothetical protein
LERFQDINELLDVVQYNINCLQASYEGAKKDDEQKSVLRPLVKTSLEHLRSILEYSAQDIWSSYNSKSKKLYFPYGKDEKLFKANLKRNLNGIREQRPKLSLLIESIQPHHCGDSWLKELCAQTNFNKHNKLGTQVRENSQKSTTAIGNLAKLGGDGTITFTDCRFNGMPLGHGKPAVISGDMSSKQIKENIGLPIPVSKEFEWVEFRFENSTIDTLSLLVKAHNEISKYIYKLELELS